MTFRQLLTTGLIVASGVTAAAQAPATTTPPVKTQVDVQAGAGQQRVDAFFKALASGAPDTFEAMAKEHYAPELLARRTPADRTQMVERIRADFGQLTLGTIERSKDGPVTLSVRGATGMQGTIEVTLGPPPAERITRVAIEVGDVGPRESAPPPDVRGTMTPAELAQGLDAYLAPLVASDAFSGVVLVARAGVPVYEKAFGPADRERKAANKIDTRFNIGSINKIFTKTAVAQLVSQGKLKLSDALGTLLPDYPNAATKAATVDQLLSHQGGIADFFGPAFDQAPKDGFRSNADYYRLVAAQAPLFAPGARREYCNGCYIVLGAIIAKVTGVPYETYIAEHVYAPAGMTTAGPTGSDAATGYTRRSPGGPVPLQTNVSQHGWSGSAAGGGYATARDLLNFDAALRAGRLADPTQTAWLLQVDNVTPGRSEGELGIAGGAPGLNGVLESSRTWTVVVLANLDPPAAQQLGVAIHRRLSR
ncbi:MAG: beta-lactamase family protein [Vicinamibacteria bacterium]|nr:beta-lactamase family protein [Vicinamibacteria bacterium]